MTLLFTVMMSMPGAEAMIALRNFDMSTLKWMLSMVTASAEMSNSVGLPVTVPGEIHERLGGADALDDDALIDEDLLVVRARVRLEGVSREGLRVVDRRLDRAEELGRVRVRDDAGRDARADVAGVDGVAEDIARERDPAGHRGIPTTEIEVGEVRLVAVSRVGRVSHLALDPDITSTHRVAGHGMVDSFGDDAESVAGAGLHVTGDDIVLNHHAGRDVDVTREHGPAEGGDAGQVSHLGADRQGAGHGVVFHDDAARPRWSRRCRSGS